MMVLISHKNRIPVLGCPRIPKRNGLSSTAPYKPQQKRMQTSTARTNQVPLSQPRIPSNSFVAKHHEQPTTTQSSTKIRHATRHRKFSHEHRAASTLASQDTRQTQPRKGEGSADRRSVGAALEAPGEVLCRGGAALRCRPAGLVLAILRVRLQGRHLHLHRRRIRRVHGPGRPQQPRIREEPLERGRRARPYRRRRTPSSSLPRRRRGAEP